MSVSIKLNSVTCRIYLKKHILVAVPYTEKAFVFIPKCQDSQVKGGVLIIHQTHNGKHQYEVDNVVKYNNTGEKMFVR